MAFLCGLAGVQHEQRHATTDQGLTHIPTLDEVRLTGFFLEDQIPALLHCPELLEGISRGFGETTMPIEVDQLIVSLPFA